MPDLETAAAIIGFFVLAYWAVFQLISTTLTIMGWAGVRNYVRRRPLRDYDEVAASTLSLPVSILVPAHNEQSSIVDSVRSLQRNQFVNLEIIVVNDGSTDQTATRMQSGFDMTAIELVPRAGLPCAEITAIMTSREDARIVLINKANGGKADALNAAINYATYPLVCAIDADTLLDRNALARLVWEFQADPTTVAVGGIVRVVNGSTFADGELALVRTPRGMIVNLQILEYLRAFLGARIGWSRLGMLLIISGAFGLFRRDAIVAAGGYDPTTVGEDAEMVLRLHRTRRDAGLPCRITFFPDPICWTEAPNSMRTLARQRDRWQRGLAQMLWRHRGMLFRPKYGRLGFFGLPYFWLFELLSPVVEISGLIFVAIGLVIGYVNVQFALLLLGLTIFYGVILSFAVISIEERAFRRYLSWRDLLWLSWSAVVENFGYRQVLACVRLRAFWTLARGSGWGEMQRVGFAGPSTPSDQSNDSS